MKKKWMVLAAAVVVALGSLSGCGEREANSDRVERDMSENLEDADREEDAKKGYGTRKVTVGKKQETSDWGYLLFGDSIENEYDEKGNIIRSLKTRDGEIQNEQRYEYDEYGNQIKYAKYDGEGNLIDRNQCKNEYDLLGNMVKKTWYDSDGNVEGWWEYEYEYGLQEIRVKQIEYYADGSTSGNRTEFEYNRLSGITKVADYVYGCITVRKEIDGEGNVIKKEEYANACYLDDDRLVWTYYKKYLTEYDENGQTLKSIMYVNPEVSAMEAMTSEELGIDIGDTIYGERIGAECIGRDRAKKIAEEKSLIFEDLGEKVIEEESWIIQNGTEYEYDENGECVKSTSYGENGNKVSLTEWVCGENGMVTRKIHNLRTGAVEESDVYQSEYDENGNLIQKTEYYNKGEEAVTRYSYDEYGNQIWMMSYQGNDWAEIRYTYDSDGNMLTSTIIYNGDLALQAEYITIEKRSVFEELLDGQDDDGVKFFL